MKTADVIADIFLDIETAPCPEPDIKSFTAKANLVDPVKIQADLEEKKDKAWRASMLNPHEGEIFVIGLGVNDDNTFGITGTDEKELMESFDEWLQGYNFPRIYAHFGKSFDFNWLFYKGLKYKLHTVVNMFAKGGGGAKLIDTAIVMDNHDYKTYTSLDKMHRLLTGEPAKSTIDGSMVFDLIRDKKGDDIINYCINEDVPALRRCVRRLSEYGLI